MSNKTIIVLSSIATMIHNGWNRNSYEFTDELISVVDPVYCKQFATGDVYKYDHLAAASSLFDDKHSVDREFIFSHEWATTQEQDCLRIHYLLAYGKHHPSFISEDGVLNYNFKL